MTAQPPLVTLDGSPLSFHTMVRIGEGKALPIPDGRGMERVVQARQVVEHRLKSGLPVYGANTGVGAMKDIEWTPEEIDEFNLGLVRAHHFGTGAPFPLSVVRNAIAIRVNTALTGRVGCSPELVEAFLGLLRADVIPIVRRTGSIGCADIGLMGQVGAALTGVGEAMYQGRRMPVEEAFAQAGLTPITMGARDSLASFSLNAVGYAATADALRKAALGLRVILATALTTAGALGASQDPWRSVAHVGTYRHADIGIWLCKAGEGWDWPVGTHIQDNLSLRMMSQVFGTAFDTLKTAGDTLLAATGRTDDNPVVIGENVWTSGGSLPLDVTVFLQAAQLSLAHVARNSFNRCVLLGNGIRRGLPINLVPHGKIATGFGPVIKLSGDLFARVLSMAQPISPQSLVVAGGIEDEAAFLPLVVERFERQVRAIRRMAAIEALLSAQAMDILGDSPGGVPRLVYDIVRDHSAYYTRDRPLSAEVEAIEEHLGANRTVEELIVQAPINELDEFFALGPVH